jgi:ElaB protein
MVIVAGRERPNRRGRLKNVMELYFKNLISDDASLEKLVDDLTEVVQGADHFAHTVADRLSEQSRREMAARLSRLKESCCRLAENAVQGAEATDKLVRENVYASLGIAALAGLIAGTVLARKG